MKAGAARRVPRGEWRGIGRSVVMLPGSGIAALPRPCALLRSALMPTKTKPVPGRRGPDMRWFPSDARVGRNALHETLGSVTPPAPVVPVAPASA